MIPFAVLCLAPGNAQVGMLPVQAENAQQALAQAAQTCIDDGMPDVSFVGVLTASDLTQMLEALNAQEV